MKKLINKARLLSGKVLFGIGLVIFAGSVASAYVGGTAGMVCESGSICNFNASLKEKFEGLLGGTTNFNDLSVDSVTASGAGSFASLAVSGNSTLSGTLNALSSYETMTAVATNTLTVAESGKIIYISTSTPQILPSTSTSAGVSFRFVVSSALTGTSTITTSDGGNDIEGVIDVNSTMVDCDAEDTITVGGAFENVGDWIELYSNGSKWFVRGNALTAGQFACSAT